MASSRVEAIVEQVKALPADDQIRVAEAIDRLTWAERWRRVCTRIEQQVSQKPGLTEEEIDEAVREVRKEKSLSERSSIPRS